MASSGTARTSRGKNGHTKGPKFPNYELNDVKVAARGRWVDILTHPSLGGISDVHLSGQHGPCPKCSGHDRFRFINADGDGSFICNQCKSTECGDGLAFLRWLHGWSFPETLHRLAEYLSVAPAPRTTRRSSPGRSTSCNGLATATRKKTPKPPKANPTEHLVFKDPPGLSPGYLALFRRARPPITCDALLACGARQATYRGRHTVFALPIYGAELVAAPPVGWAMYEATGGKLPVFKDKKIVDWVKVKLTYGSQEGLLGPGMQQLASLLANSDQFSRPWIWKLEGPSDAMSLWMVIPEEERSQHVVVTNSNGAGQKLGQYAHLLAATGSPVIVLHDADRPGVYGARRQAAEIASSAISAGATNPDVFVLQLPYALREDHGKDLRDWINEEHSFEDIKNLVAPGTAERATLENIERWRKEEAELKTATDGKALV